MIIKEKEMIEILQSSKKMFLVEPKYQRKYIPLGLAKISSFVNHTCKDIYFCRDVKTSNSFYPDTICITSLFTYDSEKVIKQVQESLLKYPDAKIIVGGIYASLMPSHLDKIFDDKICIYKGYSKELDKQVPDYSLDYGVKEKWEDFSFTFTTRGCTNNCSYCAVHRIESDVWINPNWENLIVKDKKYAMISDNNLSMQPIEHIENVCNFLKTHDKRVIFDNGFDCKHIDKEVTNALRGLKYHRNGLRLAFDRIEEDGLFQDAITMLLNSGINKSAFMSYVLYNFNDTPQDAYYRLATCIDLGIRPYPQMFTPLNSTNRKPMFIGKYWTKNLARCFRVYGMFGGVHLKMTFEEFMFAKDNAMYVELSEEDIHAWEKHK